MYLSLDWLKDFVNIPKSVSPEELGLRLTMHTVEVDDIRKQSDIYENVVVGEIREIRKHPNADRLQVATVNAGGEELVIVCGAPNIAVGQLVPVALVGAVLPNGLEIREAAVRGEKSAGMLCAEDELGLGPDHSGILILEKGAKPGTPFGDYLGLKDVIFEVDNKSITHRPDLWSHLGMAREIAAFLDVKFTPPAVDNGILSSENLAPVKVKVEDQALCPRYMAVGVKGIVIGPSPKWLQDRLIAGGVRPINNIVDVTNYVLLELGQPLHAFDRDRIDQIVVRRAKKGETIKTLDGNERPLDADMLVIADGRQPVAVAGVMGGAESEISEATTGIIIESANFDFVSIRKTSQKLGLRTEASIRYEKALDPNLCEAGIIRAVELIKKICPDAEIADALTDEKKFSLNQEPIALDLDWLNARIGEILSEERVTGILDRLGFSWGKTAEGLAVTAPSWRATRDITIPEDLLEEVARIYGYNTVTPAMPLVGMKPPEINEERKFARYVRTLLSGAPVLSETFNYSFVGEELLGKLGINPAGYLRLANPISAQHTLLRQSLATNMFLNIKTNQARLERFGLFEIGSVYFPFDGEIPQDADSDRKLPYQEKRLGIMLAAEYGGRTFERTKAVVSFLLEALGLLSSGEVGPYSPLDPEMQPAWTETGMACGVAVGGKNLGTIARLDGRTGKKLGLKKEVTVFEADLKALLELYRSLSKTTYTEPAKYPPVIRDLAFVMSDKIRSIDIMREIVNFDPLIKETEIFDAYAGAKLGKGLRNIAFHVLYRADRTLTAAEVDELQKKLVKQLEEKFDAKIRDF